MSIITDEMVEVAREAFDDERGRAAGIPNLVTCMRAALAAVAPMIAEAERERVAAAMESYEVQTKVGAIIRKIHVGPAIAAAIRARSTEEGQ